MVVVFTRNKGTEPPAGLYTCQKDEKGLAGGGGNSSETCSLARLGYYIVREREGEKNKKKRSELNCWLLGFWLSLVGERAESGSFGSKLGFLGGHTSSFEVH